MGIAIFIIILVCIVMAFLSSSKSKEDKNDSNYSPDITERHSDTNYKISVSDFPIVKTIHNDEENTIPYGEYDKVIDLVNPYTLNLDNVKIKALNSVEKAFLKYLDGMRVDKPRLARYWHYTYRIDYEYELKLFFRLNLLEVFPDDNLNTLKYADLKATLEEKGLKTHSRKKVDAIKCIRDHFTNEEIEKLAGEKRYFFKLTESGQEMVSNLHRSATYNLELEDECLRLLIEERYDEAYRKVCDFRISSPMQSGMFDWYSAKKQGWNGTHIYGKTDDEKMYSACTIFCEMMGLAYNKADVLANRKSIEVTEDFKTYLRGKRTENRTTNEIDQLKSTGIRKYKIMATCDTATCKKCARMDGKEFYVDEAIVGVNCPPFCEKCRCYTVAVFDGKNRDDYRRVRNEEGKSVVIPYANYKEWSKEYAPEKYQEYFIEHS